MKVSSYKVKEVGHNLYISMPIKGYDEVCLVCGLWLTTYGPASSEEKVWEIDKEQYLSTRPDKMLFNKRLYVLCGSTCKDMLMLNPLVYIRK